MHSSLLCNSISMDFIRNPLAKNNVEYYFYVFMLSICVVLACRYEECWQRTSGVAWNINYYALGKTMMPLVAGVQVDDISIHVACIKVFPCC